ncbi:TetR/AcrR family transcriptional regulator [Paracoccus sp. N5]|uniref:TetR/AcrR family transcriptional regulator n=1 Tax=Paracoccus sp. N5 TaxID=1101189 RepID=UPI00036E2EBC|nr:TetR/AcrR family transcriptional regulator [Paracoccus sp. N5]
MTEVKRRAGRPTLSETAELTERILNAAEASFVARGFQQTTIQQLAEDCGVTRRSIVARFSSKDELLIAVCLRDMDTYGPQLEAVEIRDDHPWEDLEQLIRKLWERGSDMKQAALLRAYLGESARLPQIPHHIFSFYQQLTNTLEGKITALQRQGLFRNYKASTVAATAISLVISNPRIRTMVFDPAFRDPITVERYFTDAWLLIREMA